MLYVVSTPVDLPAKGDKGIGFDSCNPEARAVMRIVITTSEGVCGSLCVGGKRCRPVLI